MSDFDLLRQAQQQHRLDQRIGQTEVREVPLTYSGTYTPTYLGLTTSGVTTYTRQEGSYVRSGRMVAFWGRVTWTAVTGTGLAVVSIPLTAVFTRTSRYPIYLYPVNVTFANGSIVGVIDGSTSANAFVINSPATNAAGTLVSIEAAGDLAFAGSYEVA